MAADGGFAVAETSIAKIHAAYRAGALTARALVETYLARIEAYDRNGPAINSIVSVNPEALEDAARLDAAFEKEGSVGPLHGIPAIVKDQADVAGMPTTMGSVLFRDHYPGRDCFVAARLRRAGAIFIAKSTLGEMGAGDTHGSLFGSTRNVYDLARTAGGSSGGSGAAVSANLAAVAIGQEGFASIRRPAAWNGIVGMRPTAGLVSRGGVYAGWPMINGSLGPMCRSVADAALLLDVMVGYDPSDPVTARGVGHVPESYAAGLDADGLKDARIGILREPIGFASEPESEDFARVDAVFSRAVRELADCGAELVDPVAIPDLVELLATRVNDRAEEDAAFREYVSGLDNRPFSTRDEAMASPLFAETSRGVRVRWAAQASAEARYAFLAARERLTTNLLAVMADHRLDAIVHKAVEHQPTLIADGVNPPYVDQKGAPWLNTFLVFVPSIVVPAGFTEDGLPAGITFLGRGYDDARMIRYAHAYEQATRHRRPPASTP
ncbi:MAG: amidase family protein [Defluviicoccus sp.]|nr:amidase family protein [Defluviicoccus sp.]MDE0384662.1 amidase family protein [Defluviicoccus sp.]